MKATKEKTKKTSDPAEGGPVLALLAYLERLPPEGRRLVFTRLDDFYCAVCGESTLAGGGCRCHDN
jgi:hypothetical protein